MLDTLLENYLPKDKITKLRPIDFAVETPWDYHLYLFQLAGQGPYVIVESDYLFLDEIPKDIEEAFGVKVRGWHMLLSHQNKNAEKILESDIFTDYDLENKNDREQYDKVVYQHLPTQMKYALLAITQE